MAVKRKAARKRARLKLEDLNSDELADRKREAEIIRIRTQTEKERKLLDVLDEIYLPRESVELAIARIAHVHNSYRAATESELPSLLAGLGPAEIQAELAKFNGDWEVKLRESEDEVWTSSRDAVHRELRGDMKKVVRENKRKAEA